MSPIDCLLPQDLIRGNYFPLTYQQRTYRDRDQDKDRSRSRSFLVPMIGPGPGPFLILVPAPVRILVLWLGCWNIHIKNAQK